MIRTGGGLILALLLAGCGGGDDAENAAIANGGAAANVAALAAGITPATPTPDHQDAPRDPDTDEAAIRAAVDRGFAAYRTGDGRSGFVRSPEFEAAWARAVGKGGTLDVDPYCKCQDFDPAKFRHRIQSVSVTGERARAVVDLDLFGSGPGDPFWIDFVHTGRGWRVDDVEGSEGGIKAAMRLAEPGSWAVGD